MHRIYYNKYLKYKNKYLLLKKQIGGTIKIYDVITMKSEDFVNIVKSSKHLTENKYVVVYFLDIKVFNTIYKCLVYLLKDDSIFQIAFLDENKFSEDIDINKYENFSFLSIFFNDYDSLSTNFDFNLINKKNKLETILCLLEIMYTHFGYKEINITDIAEFSCGKLNLNKYNANIYRIFATDNPIENISIYSRFKYNIFNEDYKELTECLDFVRNIKVSDFIQILETLKQYEFFIDKLKTSPDMTLHQFFKNLKMDTLDSCNSNFILFTNMKEISKLKHLSIPFIQKLSKLTKATTSLIKNL